MEAILTRLGEIEKRVFCDYFKRVCTGAHDIWQLCLCGIFSIIEFESVGQHEATLNHLT